MTDVKTNEKDIEVTQGPSTTLAHTGANETPYDSDKHSVVADDPNKPFPTEEEWATLKKVPGSIPWTAWTVAVCEFAERFSYYGTTSVCK